MQLGQDQRGFTLLELVVTFFILILFINTGYALLESGIELWSRGEEQIDVQQNVRIGMEKMLKDIYLAVRLEPRIDWYNINLSDKELILRNREGRLVAYYLDESKGELFRFANGGRNPVAYGIKSIKFLYNRLPWDSSNLVTIELVGAEKNGREFKLKSSAKIRLMP